MRMSLRSKRLFAIALLAPVAAASSAWAAATPDKVGINAAVNTNANGIPPGGVARRLVIGEDVIHNERITTDAGGQTQILFVDGSAISVGPNADLTIDDFVYNPSTSTGRMTLSAARGAMRFVGGRLSKEEDAVNVRLATGTIGIRGGVFVANIQRGGSAEVIFVYGKALTVTGRTGQRQELYRPGFAIDIDPTGAVSSPHLVPPGNLSAVLTQLDGRSGGNGGASTVPTNATVAGSGVPNTISNNLVVSVQQATAATPTATSPPVATAAPPQVPQNQIQTTSSQTQAVVANPPSPTPTTAPT